MRRQEPSASARNGDERRPRPPFPATQLFGGATIGG